MINLNSNLKELEGVGEKTSAILKKLGLNVVSDLLFFLPFRYERYSEQEKISHLKIGESIQIKATIDLITSRRARNRKMWICEAIMSSQEDSFKVTWFNQPYLSKTLKAGDTLILKGKITENFDQACMVSPEYEKVNDTLQINKEANNLTPIYHLTSGHLNQKQLRSIIKKAIKSAPKLTEWLPPELIKSLNLITLAEAISKIHFPKNDDDVKKAKTRLFFSDLFLRQLKFQVLKNILRNKTAISIKFNEKASQDFVKSLPFKLTNAQKKAAWEILKDLEKNEPMSRLLEGDVGSGKTVVFAITILNVVLNQKKAILMVPSEILAMQHFKTLNKFFADFDFKIALKTRSYKEGEADKADIIIGTQALIQKDLSFSNLGLIIVDEQHRFGINQRKKIIDLNKKDNSSPHFLSLSATPIPRSLSLAIYGDLDISIIDELPIGRKNTVTKIMKEAEREKVYSFIKKGLEKKEQCFLVYPLVFASDKIALKSVSEEYEKLKNGSFQNYKVALIHGKLKKEEKEKIMTEFSEGKIDILMATSVIEVGIDVPRATMIIIEGAERFGLAQLHQLRGRVNRGELSSNCFLFPSNDELNNDKTIKRLESLEKNHRGLELAKIDLDLRGSGQIFGLSQSGFFDLNILSLFDYSIIKKTRDFAAAVIMKDQDLNNFPLLKAKLKNFNDDFHLE